jgi:hypothetical protein
MNSRLDAWLVQNTHYVVARDAKLVRLAALKAAGLEVLPVTPVPLTQSRLR